MRELQQTNQEENTLLVGQQNHQKVNKFPCGQLKHGRDIGNSAKCMVSQDIRLDSKKYLTVNISECMASKETNLNDKIMLDSLN